MEALFGIAVPGKTNELLKTYNLKQSGLLQVELNFVVFKKLYEDTKWETLQKRRSKQKLYQLYKMINGLVPEYLQQLVPSE